MLFYVGSFPGKAPLRHFNAAALKAPLAKSVLDMSKWLEQQA